MARVIDIINEYLEKLVDIGFKHGATVDKFLGDGFMIRFNVPKPLENHQLKAIIAALEMQRTFITWKEGWYKFGFPVRDIYNRIGIACGPVYEVMLGHPQYRQDTVIGRPVVVASNLCEFAPRSRNIIAICENLYKKVSPKAIVKELPQENLGKAKSLISKAYELLDLKENKR